ncbi:MAG: TrkA family potassium uptake protein [Candidatus ainarchaeum sp.]|nr:TrkA family potassium uptake protein [Candidatus ainarchaeum sp.]MDD4662614.1 TrkA family potassium uptake protein [Candidatus ainarchaeum sp.]
MYIIVIGAGNIGYYVTQILVSENHDVIVIEKDLEKSTKVSNELDVLSIHGDATELSVLQKAGIEGADVIVCLTELDEINLVIGLIAKELGVKTVAASLSKVHYQQHVLKKLGIDVVIHPEAAAAGYISQLITQPDVLDLSFFSKGDAEIVELTINDKSKFIGKTVSKFNDHIPGDTRVIGMYKLGKFMFQTDKTILEKGDKLLVISKKNQVKSVRKLQ